MIDIIRFRELMVELQVKVNQKSEDKIDCCHNFRGNIKNTV